MLSLGHLTFGSLGGYVGIAAAILPESFGIPTPGQTAVILGAAEAGRGKLNIFAVAAVAFVTATVGDGIGYVIGRTAGRGIVLRLGKYVRLTPERFAHVETFMAAHGAKIVLVARFVDGLRQLNGIVAGTTGMPWRRFLLYNAIGAGAWVAVWSTFGYFAGNHLPAIEAAVRPYRWYAIAAAALAAAVVVAVRLGRRRQTATEH